MNHNHKDLFQLIEDYSYLWEIISQMEFEVLKCL